MHSVLAVALLGCVATASALTIHHGPIDTVADLQRDMYVNNGVYARGRDDDLRVRGVGIQQDDDGVDPRFNGPRPTGGRLQYTFKPDFGTLINPRNPASDWRWAMTSYNMEAVADNGTLIRDESPNSVNLVSLPFRSWVPQDNTRVPPIATAYEAVLVNKQNISVLPGQKLSVNVRFSCKVHNAEDSPLANNKQSVSRPEDDPTLASCGVGILSYDESALGFSILATNKGIWVAYQRNRYEMLSHPERNQREFSVFHKIARRTSPYETIDATIVYDHAENKVDFKLDGKTVYTLHDIGTINQIVREDKAYADVFNPQREDLRNVVEPQDFQVVVGLMQFPDTVDPNNPSNPPVLGDKLTTDPTYYQDDQKFEDNDNIKMYSQFGQGAEMNLISTTIHLTGEATSNGRRNPANVQIRRPIDRPISGRRGKSLNQDDDDSDKKVEVQVESPEDDSTNPQ